MVINKNHYVKIHRNQKLDLIWLMFICFYLTGFLGCTEDPLDMDLPPDNQCKWECYNPENFGSCIIRTDKNTGYFKSLDIQIMYRGDFNCINEVEFQLWNNEGDLLFKTHKIDRCDLQTQCNEIPNKEFNYNWISFDGAYLEDSWMDSPAQVNELYNYFTSGTWGKTVGLKATATYSGGAERNNAIEDSDGSKHWPPCCAKRVKLESGDPPTPLEYPPSLPPEQEIIVNTTIWVVPLYISVVEPAGLKPNEVVKKVLMYKYDDGSGYSSWAREDITDFDENKEYNWPVLKENCKWIIKAEAYVQRIDDNQTSAAKYSDEHDLGLISGMYVPPKVVKVELFQEQGCFNPWPFGKLYNGEDIYLRATLDEFKIGMDYNNVFQITFDYYGNSNEPSIGTIDLGKPDVFLTNSSKDALIYRIADNQINIPDIGDQTQTHYSMDVYWDQGQSVTDANTFDQMAFSWLSGRTLGRARYDASSQTSDHCAGQQVVSKIECISPTAFLELPNCTWPTDEDILEEYVRAGGLVYLRFNVGAVASEDIVTHSMSANWFMHSGHWAAIRTCGFDLGGSQAYTLDDIPYIGTSINFNADHEIWDNWLYIEGVVLNNCFNLNADVEFQDVTSGKEGVFPLEASINSDNNGLKWLIATKGAVILGWGKIQVTYNSSTTVYGSLDPSSNTGQSPLDMQGSTPWTSNVMNSFWVSVKDHYDSNGQLPIDDEYAKLWVEAVFGNFSTCFSENKKNVVGIGIDMNDDIKVYAINANGTSDIVEETWYCESPVYK